MILTCPSCATRFQVDPLQFGAEARKVRCSRCRATWRQEPLPEPEPPPPPAPKKAEAPPPPPVPEEDDWVPPPPPGGRAPPPPEPPPPPPPAADFVDPPPAPRISGYDDEPMPDLDRPPLMPPLDEPPSDEAEADDDPDAALARRRARLAEAGVQRAAPRAKTRRSFAWVGWLLLLGLLGGLGGLGYEKRTELIALYPPLAKVYELLGLPVETSEWLGLELHNLKSATVLDGGQTRIAVSGEVVNVGEAERPLPPIRVAMRGAGGKDLGAFTLKLEQPTIAAGEKLTFDVKLPAPREEVTDLEVAFANPMAAP